jgi:hypothetical protein
MCLIRLAVLISSVCSARFALSLRIYSFTMLADFISSASQLSQTPTCSSIIYGFRGLAWLRTPERTPLLSSRVVDYLLSAMERYSLSNSRRPLTYSKCWYVGSSQGVALPNPASHIPTSAVAARQPSPSPASLPASSHDDDISDVDDSASSFPLHALTANHALRFPSFLKPFNYKFPLLLLFLSTFPFLSTRQ